LNGRLLAPAALSGSRRWRSQHPPSEYKALRACGAILKEKSM
jgi:hypothetical protein